MKGLTPICPYCNKFSKKTTGKDIYSRRPDLYDLTFYQCKPCDASVGIHKNGSEKPLGRLANSELRDEKKLTHKLFDKLWQQGFMKRKEAYKFLAESLNIDVNDCHIGMFDIKTCKLAQTNSTEYLKKRK